MFPVKIGGVVIVPGMADYPDQSSVPVCECPAPPPVFIRLGITLSMWEPAHYIETVKDPYCFPSLGFGMSNPSGGFGGGVQTGTNNIVRSYGGTFQQAHYFIYPVYALLKLFTDSICVEASGFDIGFLTEIDPSWNDDYLMSLLDPKVYLVSNDAAQLSCVADSVACNLSFPLDAMFWCSGSWGSTYPVTGNNLNQDIIQGNIGIAYRLLYKMAQLMLICDTNSPFTICSCTITPYLIKHNYRFQEAVPMVDPLCHGVGVSNLIWGAGMNPPYYGVGPSDNFVFILFSKRGCCMY